MKKRGHRRYTQSERKGISILVSIIVIVNLVSAVTRSKQQPVISVFSNESVDIVSPAADQKQRKVILIEINSADSIDLLKLRGVGPVFSSRIIKYRNLLGGYHKPGQLLEVYGMDSVRLSGFITSIRVDSFNLEKINLRTAQFKEILHHPYISYEMVKSYVRYRDTAGPPDRVSVVWEKSIWPDSLFNKLNPYLSVGK